jgi:hypothetical protein
MNNWKSTISGSVAALGAFLFGAPIALSVCGIDVPKTTLQTLVVAGFILQGLGMFFGHLFSADAKAVSRLSAKVDQTAQAIVTGDTTFLTNPNPKPNSETLTEPIEPKP